MEGMVVQEGTSKTGTPYVIRYPKSDDAEGVWKYINRLSKEITFIRFQGEDISLEKEVEVVTNWLKHIEEKKAVVLFLEIAGEIQGITDIEMSSKTEAHTGELGISVDKSVRGQGLGEILMRTILEESVRALPQLEIFMLGVKEPNDIGVKLYEKLGFKEYGRLPNGTTQNGERVGLILMYKNV